MGYMCHHAIVVTSWEEELLAEAHGFADGLGMSVSNITREVTNGYRSFLVAPDGSKEGWDTSNVGDDNRRQLIDWLREQCYEDGSSALQWAEIQFGDENDDNCMINNSGWSSS